MSDPALKNVRSESDITGSADKGPAKSTRPDIPSIMARIRAQVSEELSRLATNKRPLKLHQADPNAQASRRAGELLHSEELRFLNLNFAYSSRINFDSITSHRPGFIGQLIVKLKRKFLSVLWNSLLKDYLASERDFQARLVRFLNDSAKYIDARDAANFWEVVRKLEFDVTRLGERIDRLHDDEIAALRTAERKIIDMLAGGPEDLVRMVARLESTQAQHEEKLKVLDAVARGLEGMMARVSRNGAKPVVETNGAFVQSNGMASSIGEVPDFSYLLLENRYRGSETEISKRMAIYPPVFSGLTKPVLEIGPGRGELQALFSTNKIKAYGVDSDEAMVEEATKKGVDVRLGDGIAHLRSLEEGSLSGVIAIQVVEHLPRAVLEELLRLCATKVEKGGKIVFETINPRSLLALSSNFYRDPTHIWPLHPDTLAYAMTLAGLKILEIKELSPVGAEASLQELRVEDYMNPRLAETMHAINRNFKQLNGLIYGFQDYCVIGQV